jgi:hypothetical protein
MSGAEKKRRHDAEKQEPLPSPGVKFLTSDFIPPMIGSHWNDGLGARRTEAVFRSMSRVLLARVLLADASSRSRAPRRKRYALMLFSRTTWPQMPTCLAKKD